MANSLGTIANTIAANPLGKARGGTVSYTTKKPVSFMLTKDKDAGTES
jgi:hypothetical protein